jgi:hypothetical protein
VWWRRLATTTSPANLLTGGVSCRGFGNGGQTPCGDRRCGEYLILDISVCLAGFAGVLCERGFESLRARALCGACAGMLGERGLGLVVHFPLEYISSDGWRCMLGILYGRAVFLYFRHIIRLSVRTPMRSMRSMRGGLFSVVEGPCKRYADTYVRPQLPPGAVDCLFPA